MPPKGRYPDAHWKDEKSETQGGTGGSRVKSRFLQHSAASMKPLLVVESELDSSEGHWGLRHLARPSDKTLGRVALTGARGAVGHKPDS